MARDDKGRLRRDEANVGPDPRQARSLVPMADVKKLKIGEGEPDIRGWPVFTSTGREVGDVQELLVDTTVMEVVMLDIDLRHDDRHTLAPLRAAWIDRDHRRVIIEASEIAEPDDLPTLGRSDTLTDDEVDEFDRRYSRAYGPGEEQEHDYRYRHGTEDELRFARARQARDPDVLDTRDTPGGDEHVAERPVAAERVERPDPQTALAEQAARDAAAAREAAERAARSAEQLAAQRDRSASDTPDDRERAAASSRQVERRRLEPGETWTTVTPDNDTDPAVRVPLRERNTGRPAPRDRTDDLI